MNRIKALRQAEGLTQKELAAILGVKQNTLSTWETGRYEPDGEMLIKIAARFSTSTDYLLGHSEKKESTTVSSDELFHEDVLDILKQFPPETMQEVERYIRFRAEQKEKP